jgi:hypothetical protein
MHDELSIFLDLFHLALVALIYWAACKLAECTSTFMTFISTTTHTHTYTHTLTFLLSLDVRYVLITNIRSKKETCIKSKESSVEHGNGTHRFPCSSISRRSSMNRNDSFRFIEHFERVTDRLLLRMYAHELLFRLFLVCVQRNSSFLTVTLVDDYHHKRR